MTDLTQLLERLESTEGPDREIDNLIAFVLDIPMPEDPAGWPPRYTSSLDAAIALVERVLPGSERHISNTSYVGKKFTGCRADLRGSGQDRFGAGVLVVSATGKTEPLALLTALVKALVVENEK